MKKIDGKKLVISLILPFLAGGIGSLATSSAISSWYAHLNKPSFNPPNWVFGPVWSLLYLLMGISLYLVWSSKNKTIFKQMSIKFFLLQIILNMAWSLIFFGLKNPFLAFLEIIILWSAIFLTIRNFYKVDRFASYLLIPYIAWVSFASILNFWIMMLN